MVIIFCQYFYVPIFIIIFFFQGKPEEDTDQMARVSYPDVKCKQFLWHVTGIIVHFFFVTR